MSPETYENFRTVLTMNLCQVLGADQLPDVLRAVDISLSDFEISRKQMELITSGDVPDVVRQYIAAKAVANISYKTLAQYRYKLINFFGTVRKSYMDITANDIRMYIYRYKVEHTASDCYLDNIRISLNGFFSWLVENDYLQKNPCAKVERIRYQPKRRDPLTSYQLELLRWNTANVREKALIDFFFSTGCRVSECTDVRLSDIDWNLRSVRIRHGKGGKSRTVFFNAEAELSMRKYLETRADETDALFVSVRAPHHPIQAHALENIITAAAKRAGLHVYPHKLRHTFATSGLRSGLPLEKLQALLGHSKPETTLIYAKLDDQDLRLEHQRVYA